MKSAVLMYLYTTKHNCTGGFKQAAGENHFKVIEEALMPDEDAIVCFGGITNNNLFAFALTNKKRLVMGYKTKFSEKIDSAYIKNVSLNNGRTTGIITFSGLEKNFDVSMNKDAAKYVFIKTQEILFAPIQEANLTTAPSQSSNNTETTVNNYTAPTEYPKYENSMDTTEVSYTNSVSETPKKAKAKKEKKKGKGCLIWIIVFFLFAALFLGGDDDGSENSTPSEPTIELSSTFEEDIWKAVSNNKGNLLSISDEDSAIYFDVECKNSEKTVTAILNDSVTAAKNNNIDKPITFTFKEKGESSNLVIADITTDKKIVYSYTSNDYKSEYNEWVEDQFSLSDGANIYLEDLIINNLQYPDSYNHVSTNFIKVLNEETKNQVNTSLKEYGYSDTVKINDLFIETTFKAKNAFGGIVQNTAFGISQYQEENIILIDIF